MEAINAAVRVMQSGRLHRYNVLPDEIGEVGELGKFAEYVGARYCLAVASGGYAMATALRTLGIGHGDRVLTNALRWPCTGAIAAVGADPVFVM